MRGLLRHIVSEPGADDARGFGRRVRVLAATYAVLFCSCIAGILLIALNGKLFVALAQRSNVETLTILFLLVFYLYLATLSAPGFAGSLRIALWAIRRAYAKDRRAEIQLQHRKLGQTGDGPWAALGSVVESDDGQPLRFELRDEHGSHGALLVQGARVSQLEAHAGGSADLIAYFVRQLEEVVGREIPIVAWGQLDDDDAERYLSQVEFARNLKKALGSGPLWPTVTVSAAHCDEIARRLEEIRPALLEDALLPDWEYTAEHKLPVIPEPLGFVSLNRSAKRADPVATMGFATLIVLLTVAVLVLFIVRPPWVPG